MITSLTSLFLAGVSITIPMDATVRGTEIEIGEIVSSITGADQATIDAIEAIELGRAPNPGFSRAIDRNMIRSKIRQQIPSLEVSFGGRAACRVKPEVQTVTKDQMLAAVDAEITKMVKGRDITWTPTKSLGALEVPMSDGEVGEAKLEAILEGADLTTGLMNVEIRVKVSGATYRTIFASWDVKVWEKLPVLVRNLPAGTDISPALFRIDRTVVPTGGVGMVLSPNSMVGAIANRTLLEGQVVTEADVARPAIMHKGDMVTLLVRKGKIRAEVTVIVQSTGSIGDMVRVVRTDTGLELSGVIKSRELVELNLDRN
jgi:flagella basal body P-ring formation protein FlgA